MNEQRKQKIANLSLYFVGIVILSACSLGGPLRKDDGAETYKFTAPRSWTTLNDKAKADHAWLSPRGSVLAIGSVCNRYSHVPLKSLTQNLYRSLGSPEIIEESTFELDGREALRTRVRARVDGVFVDNLFVVYRKNNCIFDFTLSASAELNPKDIEQFDRVVASHRYTGVAP